MGTTLLLTVLQLLSMMRTALFNAITLLHFVTGWGINMTINNTLNKLSAAGLTATDAALYNVYYSYVTTLDRAGLTDWLDTLSSDRELRLMNK